MSSAAIAREAGVTYRQLDYWIRAGYVRPLDPLPGTGTARQWPEEEREVVMTMARLVDAGFTVPAAAVLAREIVECELGGEAMSLIGDGIILVVEPVAERAPRLVEETAPL